MKTEIEIVYAILNVVRDSEHNNDERVTERLIRSFIRSHRADSLRKHYKNGHTISSEIFQEVPLKFYKKNDFEFNCKIPKIIKFDENYGFVLQKDGFSIPVVDMESYRTSKNNPFLKYKIMGKIVSNELTIRNVNMDNLEFNDNSDYNMFLKDVQLLIKNQEIFNLNNPVLASPISLDLLLTGTLLDPSDCPTYDWENDPFPFPSERLVELENQIITKEFGIMAQSKKDEIQNVRGDEIRYHENGQANATT